MSICGCVGAPLGKKARSLEKEKASGLEPLSIRASTLQALLELVYASYAATAMSASAIMQRKVGLISSKLLRMKTLSPRLNISLGFLGVNVSNPSVSNKNGYFISEATFKSTIAIFRPQGLYA